MIKVYCDTGAFRKELKSIQQVEVIVFPYENRNRKTKSTGIPSAAQFTDLGNFTWGTLPGTFGEYKGSDKYDAIEKIIGIQNRRDVLHLDSAYKSECDCFFTCDKNDIYKNRLTLSNLFNLRIYHPDEDWQDFLNFVKGGGSI